MNDGSRKPKEISDSIGDSPSHIPWIRPDLVKHKKKEPYFQTSDLVIIALFSSLGGIFSTFIGYLANLLNSLIGIPFGGGQILAGLHIFWLVFIFLLTDRKVGVTFSAGVLKGFVEFFTGNAHGLLVILLSSSQGLIIELVLILFLSTKRNSIVAIAAGFAGLSNVLLQQILFFNSQIPFTFLAMIGIISFISGMTLGGIFPISIFFGFKQASLLQWRKPRSISPRYARNIKAIRISIIVIILLAEFSLIAFLVLQDKNSIQITGEVYNPYTFYVSDFPHITIEAELTSEYFPQPPRNYTGIPLHVILEHAQPKFQFYGILLKARAPDLYSVMFNSTVVDNNDKFIIALVDGVLRLIASEYHGTYWIYNIGTIEVTTIAF
ncbi:MAG: ECF transporter S component [Candidatus Hodarchaeales archaeon]